MTSYQHYGRNNWQTEDGRLVRWADMTPAHLRNAAAFLRRSIDSEIAAAWNAYACVHGEFAEYAIESTISSLEYQREEILACAEDLEAYAAWREQHDTDLTVKLGELLKGYPYG